ncbi:hypothetical protein KY290_015861 [Solanum tuberosum]|uniref:Uncharacterized protein n=1 Tax=Solanum tuberosum TaxID=4113 RepID=A0ABQ7VTP3_SOLTU|nr:hypothetical protein KY289_015530 [Solanum tuberosum]KAH0771880.1 hypothetical protein KY290_015861 [Solanum tuberosum]
MQANPQLGNARDLLLKRVEIQHQVRNICASIHMVMLENLLSVSNPQSYMNDLMKYYSRKHRVILILMISVKHITKLLEGK